MYALADVSRERPTQVPTVASFRNAFQSSLIVDEPIFIITKKQKRQIIFWFSERLVFSLSSMAHPKGGVVAAGSAQAEGAAPSGIKEGTLSNKQLLQVTVCPECTD